MSDELLGTVTETRQHVEQENAGPRSITDYTVTTLVEYSCPRCNTACDSADYLCSFCGWVRSDMPWVCICHCVNKVSDHACDVCGTVR